MYSKKILFALLGICLHLFALGQQIVNKKSLGAFDTQTHSKLEEINALVFKPEGYETVPWPKLPDSINFSLFASDPKAKKLEENKLAINPLLAFRNPISFKKGDIYIGYDQNWFRLSNYYKYNNDKKSVEESRRWTNSINADPKSIGPSYAGLQYLEYVNRDALKLINADTALIFTSNTKFKFKDTVDNYEMITVYLLKFDLGVGKVYYYYPIGERMKALQEINQTWGVVRFKPDSEFTHPDHSGHIPKPKEPDLYYGKFAFLNNPDQLKREEENYRKKNLNGQAAKLVLEGVNFARVKDWGNAKAKYEEALKIDPNHALAYLQLTWLALEQNMEQDARNYWASLNKLQPSSAETWFVKGMLEKRFNQLDNAFITFDKVLADFDSLYYKAHLEKASIYVMRNDQVAAEKEFDAALLIFKKESEKAKRGEKYRMMQLYDFYMAKMQYARFLGSKQEFEKGKNQLEDFLREYEANQNSISLGIPKTIYGRIYPENLADVHFWLGIFYVNLKDENKCVEHFKKAKELGKVLPAEVENLLKT